MKYSDQQLQAYLDESLASDLMSAIEQQLRQEAALRERLAFLAGAREAGVHGLGEIWRRNRVSCPSRQQLGAFLLGALEEERQKHIHFHIQDVGCRVCAANLEDLKSQNQGVSETVQSRRRRYFQTSAGYLRKEQDPES